MSLTHSPGLGSGTLELRTGSHAELDVACSLNFPRKASWISSKVKTHKAEPWNPDPTVVKTA